MTNDGNRSIIESAIAKLNPYRQGDRLFGDVAATLVTSNGNTFHGVCIDTGSGTGFCAEAAAIGAMVTAGEYRINQIVAVWRTRTPIKLRCCPRVAGAVSSSDRSILATSKPRWCLGGMSRNALPLFCLSMPGRNRSNT